MAFTTDIRGDFKTVGEPYTTHFTKSGVRLFRGGCVNTSTYTAALRTCL
jgi:hypothetical protein